MKLKLLLLTLALASLSANVFANPIEGFDGFKWGTTKSEIIQTRGDEPVVWGDFEVWQAKKGEAVSGFLIKLIGYEFKDGCDDIIKIPAQPCLLWGGAYVLETTASQDIETLASLLRSKYGEDRIKHEVEEKRNPETGLLYANINTTRHIWQQPDKSAVELSYKSYDRDYVEKLNQVKKGIFRVVVRYFNPEYAQKSGTTKTRKKSF